MNINEMLINIINETKKYDEKYNTLLANILSNAESLVDISNGVYQIEHTIRANKISLKDYVLNSDVCTILKDNNIHNYSIEELRNYIAKYNSQSTISYSLALNLYEEFEQLEKFEKDKVEYEVNSLKGLIDINDISKLSKDELDSLYERVIIKIKDYSLSNDLEENMNIIINDIFNYYKNGNKEIHINSLNDISNGNDYTEGSVLYEY